MKAEQLRKSILQLAIQGKLVPQDPADEPASVLLERIRAEKQRLIKEGKIKKDKGDSVIFKGDDNCYYEKTGKSDPICIDDEVGEIELPNGWILCRLSSVADIYTGNSINENEKQKNYTGLSSGYNYIGTKDVGFDHAINYQNGVKVPFEQTSFRIAHKNTPLLCIEGGSAGRKIGILQEDVCFGNKLCAFESFGVNPKYIYYYLQNPSFTQVFKEKTTGIIGGVSVNTLKSLLFLLPPLTEQERIVTEIEKFEPLIAEYDKYEQQATKLDGEIYDKLKKSILQYAIQGKLVPQDSNDEPAAVLLERIRTEKKAQLGKKYVESYIYKGDDNCYYEKVGSETKNITDEIPFDIPDSWKWTRLNSIVSTLTDGTHRTPKYTTDGIPFLSVKDISSGKISFANTKFISIEEHNELKKRCNPQTGDILLTKVGTTGIPVIVDNDRDFSLFVSVALIKFNHNYINPAYFIYLLKSPLVQDQAAENTRGVGNKNWVLADIENTLLVIPPLAEQKRIIEQINVIFSKLKDEI
mgnify:FL=1